MSVDEIVVLGGGESRQVQTVSGDVLRAAVPGASPLKLVERLPNVNLQSADAFGAYEWSTRINIRGFDQSQLGFTLDDVPLGDMTYGNHNGLHISRAIQNENVGQVELAQGAGALATASDSNLGGTLKYRSRDPGRKFGVYAAATGGVYNLFRGFARLDTGELATGARAYLSLSANRTDKWKGSGHQNQDQFNAKVVQPVGQGELSAWINGSRRRENDYQDLSLERIQRLGRDWDNVSDNYQLAVLLAEIGNNRGETGVAPAHPELGTTYPGKITNVDDAYLNASGLRDDLIGAVTLDYPLTDNFKVRVTGYGHSDKGQGLWGTPYSASPNYGVAGATTDDSPISIRTTEYDIKREGVVAGATLDLGPHTLDGGLWYEHNRFEQARRFYALNRSGQNRDFLEFQSNPYRTQWDYDFLTTTTNFYLQDLWKVTDALSVNFGFKTLSVKNEVHTIFAEPGNAKEGSIEAKSDFLPQAGFRYALSRDDEVFGDYSRNIRAFPSSGTAGPFSASAAGFNAVRDKLEPETADTYELGWRFHRGEFQGVLAAYYVKFKNRLFAVPVGPGIVGNPSALSNVGGVTGSGFEAAGSWAFAEHWSLFGSYAYNNSRYDGDTRDGSGVIVANTAGKHVVDTPENLLKGEVAYENGPWFGSLSMNYLGKRYFSYENDQSVPSQTRFDLSAGYRFSGPGLVDDLEIQVNVTNLLDEDYISTINSNGFPIRGDSQTLLPGPPREAFLTVRKQF